MSDLLVKVENLSKKFTRNLKRSLYYGAVDVSKGMLGLKSNPDKLRKSEFWALKDISFELKRGQCLGLIGRNGSGKSTLLRLLSGILPPDKGRITLHGKIGGLIALGAGFHPHMNGKENIYLNGSIMGLSRVEIRKKFDAIIEFAELGEFINAPVATYSSGMRVRLGFAIASQIEPDVLLVDEVLAVGDMGFRMKCYNRINELIEKSAVIFVSHAIPQVARISSDILVLEKGETVIHTKDIGEGIEKYYDFFDTTESKIIGDKVHLDHIKVYTDPKKNGIVEYGKDMEIEIQLTLDQVYDLFSIGITFFDKEQRNTASSKIEVRPNSKRINIKSTFKNIQFGSGIYNIMLTYSYKRENNLLEFLGRADSICEFKSVGIDSFNRSPFFLKSENEIIKFE